ncbi:hypothetical protein AGMMS4956_18440 [Bacteroidia bacterium]|nr:hypothetical protein AGMMS4956_18440 [Bacteroidia bacterium]
MNYELKKYTQFGTWMVVLLLPLCVLLTLGAAGAGEWTISAIVTVIVWLLLLLMYQLTITVSETHIRFTMGVGWVGKSYKIADIQSCKVVQNSVWTGWGIRKIRNGWLYTVEGWQAVELHFVDTKKVVRIGTDHACEVCDHIRALIGDQEPALYVLPSKASRWVTPIITLVILLLYAGIFAAHFYNFMDTRVQCTDNELIIEGIYGVTIPRSEIEQVDTLAAFPSITWRTNGYAWGNTRIGNFKMEDGSSVKLFIKKGAAPYIVIQRSEGRTVYLNFEEKQKTVELYNQLTIK